MSSRHRLRFLGTEMRLRTFYVKAGEWMPSKVLDLLESLPIHPFGLLHSAKVRRAIRSGPPYRPSHRSIAIDITAQCNLRCVDCNRSCGEGQAMSDDRMSVAQIGRFVGESGTANRRWDSIELEGGEPTLHPEFFDILSLLLNWRNEHSPWTNIKVFTNGYGDRVRQAIDRLTPLGVDVYNSRKRSPVQGHHVAFNVAPCELPEHRGTDFSQGCYLPACRGLGLTKYGYYPHPVCGGIDRVFGFDIGRKTLPGDDDPMTEHFERLCRFCGMFLHRTRPPSGGKWTPQPQLLQGQKTESWNAAYRCYRQKKPDLTPY
jgi:hypothetical protein